MTLSFILFSSLHIFTLAYSLRSNNEDLFNFFGPLSYALLFLNSLINPVLFLLVSTQARLAMKKMICGEVAESDSENVSMSKVTDNF